MNEDVRSAAQQIVFQHCMSVRPSVPSFLELRPLSARPRRSAADLSSRRGGMLECYASGMYSRCEAEMHW